MKDKFPEIYKNKSLNVKNNLQKEYYCKKEDINTNKKIRTNYKVNRVKLISKINDIYDIK